MMELFYPDKPNLPDEVEIKAFLQLMVNRIVVGRYRYGREDKRKKYFSRALTELGAYKKSGNFEHLINTAVYMWLESQKPENPLFHFDNTVESVTRNEKDKNTGKHQPFEYDPT